MRGNARTSKQQLFCVEGKVMLHVRGEGMYEEYTSELGQETSGVKM
jgi:hypothetical protein